MIKRKLDKIKAPRNIKQILELTDLKTKCFLRGNH